MSNQKVMHFADFKLVHFFKKILKCTFLCTYKNCLTTKNVNNDDEGKYYTLITAQISMFIWKMET